ncbi:pentatricopeptide repeat-containing protein At1g11710, mitochondrial [Punica granatum]|uniref:Pentatricopeptide repeat-containing protein At1g11710, mitochondrial n=1 Tax=Punica granatum TaxID=22663 RepID=A0A6P8DGZ7_PUNGR|nr:pentatricopeptide repeat-containing protein At1g11710, mitochondrial [Punica granatum]XP_031392556.1 pentatricopeptide repeat-containing protein At1g11710, mitochondrial [Punica granatum]XP_031392557.1 pentatricopeptide repeat-containing protein At1g11710, mitochondrial [Punica granatum]
MLLTNRAAPVIRAFHAGKRFSNFSPQDILLRTVCLSLRQRKWKSLDPLLPSLTTPLVAHVVRELRDSPQLAMEFYSWVREKKGLVGHSLDSCCCLVHVLVRGRKFDETLVLLKELISSNGVSPVEILEGLVRSFESCCSSIAALDSLVRACTLLGDADGAYEVIMRSRVMGFQVTVHSWNNFLNHLLKANDLGRFWRVYGEMVSYRYVENVNSFNLLIYALCREFKPHEAISVFYRMLKCGTWPNVVTFNMMIDGACRANEMGLAVKILRNIGIMSRDLVGPNLVTYNCIINGFCKTRRLKLAKDICREMNDLALGPNLRTYATLVDGYLRNGNSEEAFGLCDEMVEKGLTPNVVVYNSLIYRLHREGNTKDASFLLFDMVERQLSPDSYTHSILLEELCSKGFMNKALMLHSQVLEEKLVVDNVPHNVLIKYLCRSKQISGAKQLLCSMFVRGLIPDLVTYSTLIDGYLKEGDLANALTIYHTMVNLEKSPNLVVYNSFVNGFCKMGLLDLSHVMANLLSKMGMYDTITFNTLLNGYLLSGNAKGVCDLVSKLGKFGSVANVVTYNTLINFMCKCGCISEAKKLVEVMVHRGIVPDAVTYTTLIMSSLKRTSSPEEVIDLHDFMVLKGVVPVKHTYQTAVKPFLAQQVMPPDVSNEYDRK